MRILIVGAGIAGLSAYRALAARGFSPRIVEKSGPNCAGGAGMFLPGNSVRALAQLDVMEPLLRQSHPIEQQHFYDSRGGRLSSVDARSFWAGIGPCLGIKRSALWSILRRGIADEHVEQAAVTGVLNTQSASEVTFDNGTREEYDLVIGADGINSTVRHLAFQSADAPLYKGFVCWRYLAQNVGGIRDWTVLLGPGKCVLAVPVSPDEVYVYADVAVGEANIAGIDRSLGVTGHFDDIAGPIASVLPLAENNAVHFGKIMQLKATDASSGQIVLIGDAAHASSPSMAEGAGLAVEDALVLADELSCSTDVQTALARFKLRRQPRVDWVQRQCDARDRVRLLPRPLRNSILRLGGAALYSRSYRPLREEI